MPVKKLTPEEQLHFLQTRKNPLLNSFGARSVLKQQTAKKPKKLILGSVQLLRHQGTSKTL